MPQEAEAVCVHSLWSDPRVKSGHRLGVVVEDVRSGSDDGTNRLEVALEVRRQDLDRGVRAAAADRTNRAREDTRASVLQIVAVYRRDDSVLQAKVGH